MLSNWWHVPELAKDVAGNTPSLKLGACHTPSAGDLPDADSLPGGPKAYSATRATVARPSVGPDRGRMPVIAVSAIDAPFDRAMTTATTAASRIGAYDLHRPAADDQRNRCADRGQRPNRESRPDAPRRPREPARSNSSTRSATPSGTRLSPTRFTASRKAGLSSSQGDWQLCGVFLASITFFASHFGKNERQFHAAPGSKQRRRPNN